VTDPKYLKLPGGWELRIGRGWELFSERYQGQHGIPKRFHYLFGKRLTLIAPRPSRITKEDA
jgi:hypothetical protein